MEVKRIVATLIACQIIYPLKLCDNKYAFLTKNMNVL